MFLLKFFFNGRFFFLYFSFIQFFLVDYILAANRVSLKMNTFLFSQRIFFRVGFIY